MIEFLLASMPAATPLLLATLGALVGQRAGVLNLGIEGALYLSGALAAYFAANGVVIAIIISLIIGIIYNLIYYFLINYFALNQIVLGVAFTLIGYGLGVIIARGMIGAKFGTTPLDYSSFFYAIVLAIAVFLVFKHKIGIAIRASGDDPQSLDLMGIDVYSIRLLAGAIEGIFVSLSGSVLTLFYYRSWSDRLLLGWGSLAVIMSMASLWNPIIAIGISLIPPFFTTLGFSLQASLGLSPHLLNAMPYITAVAVLTISQIYARVARARWALPPRWLAKSYLREERT